MTLEEVMEYYGKNSPDGVSQANAVADALQVSRPAIAKWNRQGFIPWNTQFRIQVHTEGKLTADIKTPNPVDYSSHRKA